METRRGILSSILHLHFFYETPFSRFLRTLSHAVGLYWLHAYLTYLIQWFVFVSVRVCVYARVKSFFTRTFLPAFPTPFTAPFFRTSFKFHFYRSFRLKLNTNRITVKERNGAENGKEGRMEISARNKRRRPLAPRTGSPYSPVDTEKKENPLLQFVLLFVT